MNTSSARRRFAAALKQARLNKHWRQEDLAGALHVNLRTAVSWEAGERIPSAGIVFLLCMVLTDAREIRGNLLACDLFTSYLVDDLERQTETHDKPAFSDLAALGIQRLRQFADSQRQSSEASETNGEFLKNLDLFGGGRPIKEERQPYSWQSDERQDLASPAADIEQLFAVFDLLRRHPDLIGATSDFLHEIASPQ